MAKNKFLIYFQIHLVNAIDKCIKEWGFDNFIVKHEGKEIDGQFNGFIDILIENTKMQKCIVAIEIEYKSSYSQAKKNIRKLKDWTHKSGYRKCGFLHLIHEE